VRPAGAEHHAGIRALLEHAFEGPDEADLVENLRARADPVVELVALVGGGVVGQIALSPARVAPEGGPAHGAWALAPMAVHADHRRRGLGGVLVHAACEAAEAIVPGPIFVLGHPEYYPRFGFQPAVPLGFTTAFLPPDAPSEAFMVRDLLGAAVRPGPVAFHEAFDRFLR
jgi:putative acetyltransferase